MLSIVCADLNNRFRVRLSSLRRRKKRFRTLCQQFQLSKRFPDPQRKYVVDGILCVFLRLTLFFIVCVSSLMVEEIKRIIRTSEIMKYAPQYQIMLCADLIMKQGR